MQGRVLVFCAVLVLFVSFCAMAAVDPNPAKQGYWPGETPKISHTNTVRGQVISISANSITVQGPRKQFVFIFDNQTNFRIQDEPGTVADIKSGDTVIVKSILAPDGSRFAKAILVPVSTFEGKINALSSTGLTLTSKDRVWSVIFTPGTKIFTQGKVGSAADLRVGYAVTVRGDQNGDNITAKVVRFRPDVIKGIVDQVNGNHLVVKTIRQKMITVGVDSTTFVLVRPRTAKNYPGTLNDVKPGSAVNIGGHRTGEAVMTALWIDLLIAQDNKAAPASRQVPVKKQSIKRFAPKL